MSDQNDTNDILKWVLAMLCGAVLVLAVLAATIAWKNWTVA